MIGVYNVTGGRPLHGEVVVPGDKSISHRGAIIGALAGGLTEVKGFLAGADCLSTLGCLGALGVAWELEHDHLVVRGKNCRLQEPETILDAGNSGTTMRLLMGILAGQGFHSVLTGDSSLRNRPMGRVAEPLRFMGATVLGRRSGSLAPLAISGGGLKGINYSLPVASAQLKSAILLAGVQAEGVTRVEEPLPSRDHTERMLRAFGADIAVEGLGVRVTGKGNLEGIIVEVPGDFSSAAFFIVAATLVPDSEVLISRVGLNPTRTGLLDVLKAMGANVAVLNLREIGGEPVGDLLVKSASLRGTCVTGELVPRLVDEVPALAVAALAATGETVITGAAELRVKESDRISALVGELRSLGGELEELPDGMVIHGGRPLVGTRCHSHGDHRMAMALGIAGLMAHGTTSIEESGVVAVSYPGFFESLVQLMA